MVPNHELYKLNVNNIVFTLLKLYENWNRFWEVLD